MRNFLQYFWFFSLLAPLAAQSDIKVGLEPFPPFVFENGGGMTVDMLKKLEKKTGDKFTYTVAPYKRLKRELEQGKLDLIGHTPYQSEVEPFYKKALELDWSYPVCTEFLFLEDFENKETKPVIGTLTGNKDFLESFEGMKNYEIFEHVDMEALLKMLKNKRVDGVWFGRPVHNYYLQKVEIPGVKRKTFPKKPLAVGFAVRKNPAGIKLKKKIEEALSEIEWKKSFDIKFRKDLDCASEKEK